MSVDRGSFVNTNLLVNTNLFVDEGDQVFGQLRQRDRQAAHPRVALAIHQVLAAQDERQLTQVHLGHDHPVVAAQDVAQVGRQRVQVPQMHGGDVPAAEPDAAGGRRDRTV